MTNGNVGEFAQRVQYQTTVKTLGPDPTVTQILTLIDTTLDFTFNLLERIKSKSDPLACEAGCNFCCYLMATVSAPEALAIAHRLKAAIPPEELDRLKQKVTQAYGQTRPMDNIARIKAHIPCPFLTKSGLCAIYAYRPLDCMTYHSLSRPACEALLEQPGRGHPTNAAVQAAGMGIKAGLGYGLAEANLEQPSLRYELIEAIHLCLQDERAMAKYLSGKNIFHPAAIIIDPESQVTHKIKYAPPPLKAQARRVFAAERRQARRATKKRRKRRR